jgi:hypothetical protein
MQRRVVEGIHKVAVGEENIEGESAMYQSQFAFFIYSAFYQLTT